MCPGDALMRGSQNKTKIGDPEIVGELEVECNSEYYDEAGTGVEQRLVEGGGSFVLAWGCDRD